MIIQSQEVKSQNMENGSGVKFPSVGRGSRVLNKKVKLKFELFVFQTCYNNNRINREKIYFLSVI